MLDEKASLAVGRERPVAVKNPCVTGKSVLKLSGYRIWIDE